MEEEEDNKEREKDQQEETVNTALEQERQGGYRRVGRDK
jgi:hypothetical protein